jgi:hypothetical protein
VRHEERLVSLPDRRLQIGTFSFLGFLALALGGLRGPFLIGLAPKHSHQFPHMAATPLEVAR